MHNFLLYFSNLKRCVVFSCFFHNVFYFRMCVFPRFWQNRLSKVATVTGFRLGRSISLCFWCSRGQTAWAWCIFRMFAIKKWHLSRGFSGKYWCLTFDSCGLRYIRSGASAGWPRDCGLTPTRKTTLEQRFQWSGSKLRARVHRTLIRPLLSLKTVF